MLVIPTPAGEAAIRHLLLEEYDVTATSLQLLAGGIDHRASTYRVHRGDREPLVVRLTAAEPAAATYAVPRHLRDAGIEAVVAPLRSRAGELVVRRDGLSWSVFPFVDGADGWGGRLTSEHWRRLGAALLMIHRTAISPHLQPIRTDAFDIRGYEQATQRADLQLAQAVEDPDVTALAEVWADHRTTILSLLEQMVLLAADLRDHPRPQVLCHGDLHPGNVLVGDSQIHVVDWDTVLMAPRERDLLFVPGLPPLSETTGNRGLDTAFFDGYVLDGTDIDWIALTYYRCERVIEDVIAFADDALDRGRRPEVRAAAAGWVRHVMQPGGEVDTAVAAARCLPAELDRLDDVRRERRSTST